MSNDNPHTQHAHDALTIAHLQRTLTTAHLENAMRAITPSELIGAQAAQPAPTAAPQTPEKSD